jgi:hypothetical protein
LSKRSANVESGETAETIYHSDDIAHVTGERVIFGAQSYELAALKSARLIAKRLPQEQLSGWQQAMVYITMALLTIRTLLAVMRSPAPPVVKFAAAAVMAGLVTADRLRSSRSSSSHTYTVQLRPSHPSAPAVRVYTSTDAGYVERLVEAVNRAIRENRPVGEPKPRKYRKRRKRKRPRAPRAKGALSKRRYSLR